MAIYYDQQKKIFQLDTCHTSYLIAIIDKEQFLGHLYYGKKIRCGTGASYLLRLNEAPFVPSENEKDRSSFLDFFPMEYAGSGLGDYRESCITVLSKEGHSAVSVTYSSYEIMEGKPVLEGLPATFCQKGDSDCQTLCLHCTDDSLGLRIDLYYSVFEKEDVITRSVKVINQSSRDIYLTKVYSACLDLEQKDYEMLTLHGSWARERQPECSGIRYGRQNVGSTKGESSHQEHPFLALKGKNTTQDQGEVYAMHFVYSGNFLGQVELGQFDAIRMTMGIHPENFCWKLGTQEAFTAPEVVMTYSDQGLGKMTRSLHDLYRRHLIRSPYLHKPRPVLINNWEATYFDFDSDKLLAIAKRAASLGIEMLVMDDGWFGKREDDTTSLGDWEVNEEKLKGGLSSLVQKVNALGMQFGIWFEPEMISPDSALYRKHPDWAICIPGRKITRSRNQYVLDLSRKEVREYAYECVAKILRSANISYVKWDMNRQLSDLGSFALSADRQGELSHRHVLGVYEMQEKLMQEFPDLLLENCSGGGARFDPGMLYYSPQIWCSDDTDAVERLKIQEGTQICYPLSAIGAHVSDCPNHTVGRNTPFATRGIVALSGTFGYELDITKISPEDQKEIPHQIACYHKFQELIREGDYYRVASYLENHQYDCWMSVSGDQTQALVSFVQVMACPNTHSRKICLKGLDPSADYRVEEVLPQEKEIGVFAGDLLQYAGMVMETLWGDFQGRLYHLTRIA